MTNVVKKHSISSELAQKMVDATEAKAGEIVGAIGLSGAPTVQNAVAAAFERLYPGAVNERGRSLTISARRDHSLTAKQWFVG